MNSVNVRKLINSDFYIFDQFGRVLSNWVGCRPLVETMSECDTYLWKITDIEDNLLDGPNPLIWNKFHKKFVPHYEFGHGLNYEFNIDHFPKTVKICTVVEATLYMKQLLS